MGTCRQWLGLSCSVVFVWEAVWWHNTAGWWCLSDLAGGLMTCMPMCRDGKMWNTGLEELAAHGRTAKATRSSTITEELRDELCQLKACQLLHNCTKIPFEKAVIDDLEGHSRSLADCISQSVACAVQTYWEKHHSCWHWPHDQRLCPFWHCLLTVINITGGYITDSRQIVIHCCSL